MRRKTGYTKNMLIAVLTVMAILVCAQAALAEELLGRISLAASNRPVSSVKVMVQDIEGQNVASVMTDSEGRYRVAELTPGEYTVLVFSPKRGSQIAEQGVTVERGSPTRVSLEIGPRKSLWGQALKQNFM